MPNAPREDATERPGQDEPAEADAVVLEHSVALQMRNTLAVGRSRLPFEGGVDRTPWSTERRAQSGDLIGARREGASPT